MATKKKGGKRKPIENENPQQTDPIIVGGGGSTYILIRKDVHMQFVEAPAGVFGSLVGNYFALKCDIDISIISVSDGISGHNPVSPPGHPSTGHVSALHISKFR